MRRLHIRPLQPSNNRSPKIHALHDGDESLSNGVAAYDTTEDVDEDGSDFRIAGDEIEGLFNRLRRSSATNIKKVGGSASIEFNYVHGCHCKTGAVDYQGLEGVLAVDYILCWKMEITETANVTIQFNKVEAMPE